MPLLAIPFPAIDPVAISLGPVAIRWYALAYIVGLLIGWRYCLFLADRPPHFVERQDVDDFLTRERAVGEVEGDGRLRGGGRLGVLGPRRSLGGGSAYDPAGQVEGQAGVTLRAAELAMLLDGVDWQNAKRSKRYRRPATAAG